MPRQRPTFRDEASQALLCVFGRLNELLFGSCLPQPSLDFDIGRPFQCKWLNDGNIMCIGAGFGGSTLLEFKVAVLHEMLHMSNMMRRVADLSVNQYHNKNFAVAALAAGLYCFRHRKHGWSLVSPVFPSNVSVRSAAKVPAREANDRLLHALAEIKFSRKQWRSAADSFARAVQAAAPAKVFQHKYVCECGPPHNSVRCGRRPDGPHAPDITCNRCGARFVCVTDR